MKTIIWVSILLATIAFTSMVHAQLLETNVAADQSAATNTASSDNEPLIPLIQLKDVSITTVIEALARQAGINYIIDPKLFPISDSKGNPISEPMVTFHLENVTARDTLTRMLNLRNIAMIEDPVTGVVRITRAGKPTNVMDASLIGVDTNNPVSSTNDIPVIKMQDVALDVALKALIQAADVKIGLDPRISTNYTLISLRWQNITVKQAIIALCQNYDLDIVKDVTTGVIEIKPKSDAENK